jgi:hypothetical protein
MADIPQNPFDQNALDNLEDAVDLSRALVDNANQLRSALRQSGQILATEFNSATKSISKNLNDIATQFGKLSLDEFKRADAIKLQNKLSQDLVNLAREKQRIEDDILPRITAQYNIRKLDYNNLKQQLAGRTNLTQQERESLDLAKQAYDEAKRSLDATNDTLLTTEQITQAAQEQNAQLQIYVDRWNQANLKLGLFGKALNGLKKIPILGDLMNSDKALKAMQKSALDNESSFKTMGKGISAAFSGIEKSTVILAVIGAVAKAVKFFVDAMFAADKQVTRLAQNLSISKDEAGKLKQAFSDTKDTLETEYKLTEQMIVAQESLSKINSASILYSRQALDNQIMLTKELGLSEDAATNLNATFISNTEQGKKSLDIVYDQIAGYANQNKVLFNGRKILTEMSKINGQILATFKGNTAALANAVMRAERLGVTLEKARGISESMLDFESSINAQMEAELLIGRSLNLDRARALALQGDFVGATEEIMRNVGDYNQFSKMNVLQQQALAKAVGMTADELADSLRKQQLITGEAKEQIARLRENRQNERADAIEKGILQGKNLKEAEKSIDAQEKFNIALERMKEKFTDLVTGGTLDRLADLLNRILDALESVDARENRSKGRGAELMKQAKSPEQQQAIQADIEASQKGVSIWRRILSAAVGGPGAAAMTELQNESSKAAAARLQKGEYFAGDKGQVNAKDFVIKTLPEDTVVAAGGTSLGNSKEMLAELKEQNRLLAALVAKNTAIQVDGQVIANVVAKNVPTTPGNLLNPGSRAYG